MHTRNTYGMTLMEGRFEHDDSAQFRANFALHGGNGAEHSAVVSIVLEPGKALGEHVDSPEEILFVVDGNVEFTVGDEVARASRGTLAVVPPKVPHSIRNIGPGIARIIGFFPSPTVVSAFVEPVMPANESVLTFGGLTAEAIAAD
jgi:quercetin dioxygenase-like cupin family protein